MTMRRFKNVVVYYERKLDNGLVNEFGHVQLYLARAELSLSYRIP